MTKISKHELFERYLRARPRGRPRGRFNVYKDLRSLLTVAKKYGLNPRRLVNTCIEAWNNSISCYGRLKIHCRRETKNHVTLMITKEMKVISQFQVNVEILRNPNYYVR